MERVVQKVQFPDIKLTSSTQSQPEKVFCKSYGVGEIIKRYESNGRMNITVKFEFVTKSFDEEKAYTSGFLKNVVG